MLLLHNIVFFLLPASGADVPNSKVVGEDLLPQRLLDPLLHIRQANVRNFPATTANQVIVPFRPVVPVRRPWLGDAEQKPLLRQTVQVLIYRTQSDAGMLLFHLQEHLLRRGMPLKPRYGSQYLLCVFRHIARLQKTGTILILVFHYTHIHPVVNSYGGLTLKKG